MPFFIRTSYVAKDRKGYVFNGHVSRRASYIIIQFWSLFSAISDHLVIIYT